MTQLIYCASPLTSEYLGQSTADESPLEPGVYLIPAHASDDPPPPTVAREVAVLVDGAWLIRPDWRGVDLYSTLDGAQVVINSIGTAPDDINATEQPRPDAAFVWDGAQWREDAEKKRLIYAEISTAYLNGVRLIRETVLNRISGLGFAAMAADDTATVQAILTARLALLDITKAPAVLEATDSDSLKEAVLATYREIAAAAPASIRNAFAQVDL